MATRKQIREAFYSHLETAVSGYVEPSNIGEEEPETEEEHPSLVHNDDYRKIEMNQASGAPSDVLYDSNGNATTEIYKSVHEGSFGVVIEDHDEQRKESIYEALRSYFEKYEFQGWDASTVQSDIEGIRVLDANSEDDTDSSPTVRGDRIIIRIQFVREHQKDVDATTSVNRIGDTG